MNELTISCPACRKPMTVDIGFVGMTVRCSECREFVQVPRQDEASLDEVLVSDILGRPDTPLSEEEEDDLLERPVTPRPAAPAPQQKIKYCPICRRRLVWGRGNKADLAQCPECKKVYRRVRRGGSGSHTSAGSSSSAGSTISSGANDSSMAPLSPQDSAISLSAAIPMSSTATPHRAGDAHLPRKIVNSIGLTMILVPAGSYMMGGPRTEPGRRDDETQHPVQITRPFYLSSTLVTQAQWEAVMGSHPALFKNSKHPVERITWFDAVDFCQKLTEKENHWWARLRQRGGKGRSYRLPTEAQWEYACRAGSVTAFHWGRRLTTEQANFDGRMEYADKVPGRLRARTSHVTRFKPNAWGFYDMHGNVQEWVADWYGEYPERAAVDPLGPAGGSRRLLRGGSWQSPAADCRSASRAALAPGMKSEDTGFRVAMEVG